MTQARLGVKCARRRSQLITTIARHIAVVIVIGVTMVTIGVTGLGTDLAVSAPVAKHALTWAATETPLPANASTAQYSDVLSGLVCRAGGSCIATGSYTDTNGSRQGVIETLSGGKWTPLQAPLPANAAPATPNTGVDELSCPARGTCVAVGVYDDASGTGQGLIETLSGGRWTAAEAPLPTNASATQSSAALSAITCRAGGFCIATGVYVDTNGNHQGLIETLSGGRWTAAEAPLPANASTTQYSFLGSVVCPGTTFCVALGQYVDPISSAQSLFETLSAGTWMPTEAPLPANATAAMDSGLKVVTCTKAGSCLSVGFYTDTDGNAVGLIETRSRGTWTASEAPLPPSTNGTGLDALTCSTDASCVAVGNSSDTNGTFQALIAARSGRSWTATQAPLPVNALANPAAALGAVDCVNKHFCVALGDYNETGETDEGLMETLSGGTWTASEAPLPANASLDPEVSLQYVVCADAGSCVALGGYRDTSGNEPSLIETSSHGMH